MKQEKSINNSILNIFRRYGYYIVLGSIAFIMATIMIAVAMLGANKPKNIVEPASSNLMTMPVANCTIIKSYDENNLQFNEVLNQWEIHKGVDFAATKGTNVVACMSGTVSKVYTNSLDGTVIEIDHGNNVKSVYGSLDSSVNVAVGDVVNSGDVLGQAGNSGVREIEESHLHFEVWENGSQVNPEEYLNAEAK